VLLIRGLLYCSKRWSQLTIDSLVWSSVRRLEARLLLNLSWLPALRVLLAAVAGALWNLTGACVRALARCSLDAFRRNRGMLAAPCVGALHFTRHRMHWAHNAC
jgi:hypothetical protein